MRPRRRLLGCSVLLLFAALSTEACAQPASPPAGARSADSVRVSILAAGDVIPHDAVLEASRSPGAPDGHDFSGMLSGVKAHAERASLAIVNFEATMSGDGEYSGYPSFDAPPSLAEALARSGFDVAAMANNHMFDQGLKGFDSTLPLLRARGLSVAGARLPGEPRWIIREAAGVKVAVIAYTYALGPEAAPRFNGFAPPPDAVSRVNYFVPGSPERPLKEFASAAAEARAAGARIVVAYVHWGEEYEASARPRERSFASSLVEAGADAVFGTHPHVVQGAEVLQARDGRLAPVFYSLGNFLSNQRRDTVDNPATEDGLMAVAEFDVPFGGGRPVLVSARALPTWVKKTEPPAFKILPLAGDPSKNPDLDGLAEMARESIARSASALGLAYDPALPGFALPVPATVILPVPFFGQTLEWPWGGDFMGDARALIADNGCVMTSTAMVMAYHGIDIDPRRLDKALIKAGAYLPMSFQGEALGRMSFNFSSIPAVFPAIASVRTRSPVRDDADLDFARASIRAGNPVVLLVMSPRGFSHGIVAVGVSGKDIVINDPLDRAARSLLGDYGRKTQGNAWPLAGVIMYAAVYEPAKPRPAAQTPRGTDQSPTAAAPTVSPSASAVSAAASAIMPASPVAGSSEIIAPRMVRLDGGSFVMGARGGQSYFAEEPPHEVLLSPFLAATKEVTVAEFSRYVEETGYTTLPERGEGAWTLEGGVFDLRKGASWRSPGFSQKPDEPVVCVAWDDAIMYCNWLSAREGLRPAYAFTKTGFSCDWGADGYRLPTEAEWEFAARAGKVRAGTGDFAGLSAAEGIGWVRPNSGERTRSAGLKPANANGLHDTVGGVFEWCWDRFGQDYYAVSPRSDPRGPDSGDTRVARGGSWASRPRNARSSQRYARLPREAASYLGFRVFRSIPR